MKTALACMLTLASILIACGGDSGGEETPAPSPTAKPPAEIPIVEITKTELGFEAPDSIPGGLTRLRVHNADTGQHAVLLLRFNDEGTLDQLNDAYRLGATNFPAAAAELYRLTTTAGGTGNIAAGRTQDVVLDLDPGRYAIVRFPSVGNPLTRELEVTAAPDVRPAPPESAFTVRMLDFAYVGFPDTLPAGKVEFEVANEGEQLHVMIVQRVNEESVTADQVRQHLSGSPLPVAPSFSAAGGMGELLPGDSGWVTLDLEPGVYALICIVFDVRAADSGGTGKLHADLGMHDAFTVE